MRARPIGRALRFAAPAVAAASVVAAGGSVAAPASAGEQTCDDGALTTGDAPVPCVATVPPPVVTEPGTVEEPPLEAGSPPAPPPVVTTMTARARARARTKRSALAKTSAAAPRPPTTRPVSSGGILGSGFAPPNNGAPTLSGGPYVFPVIGQTSFVDTWGAARATVGWHHGVDIFAPVGSPIVAVAAGEVLSVGWNGIGGRRLWLRDRGGNYFYYAHLTAFSHAAVDGARVAAGTVIGYVGNTGDAAGTPYHLHFEIHPVSLLSLGYDGAVDPFSYVSSWRRLDRALSDISAGVSTPAAPAPGAFLLGFTDISSASGLSPASLEHTVDDAAVTVAAIDLRESATTSGDDAAEIARSLDLEAAGSAGYGASIWDRLAICESGGDWGASTGNGFIGGLQFLPQTWYSHGGSAFAPSPNLATREQQIAVAKRVLDSEGWGAWPVCSAFLGLRTLAKQLAARVTARASSFPDPPLQWIDHERPKNGLFKP